jgi:hypothetical protein
VGLLDLLKGACDKVLLWPGCEQAGLSFIIDMLYNDLFREGATCAWLVEALLLQGCMH